MFRMNSQFSKNKQGQPGKGGGERGLLLRPACLHEEAGGLVCIAPMLLEWIATKKHAEMMLRKEARKIAAETACAN